MQKYVINASPIISLSKAGLSNILDSLDFYIPRDVFEEIQNDKYADEAKQFVQKNKNKLIQNYTISDDLFNWGLGKGETSVIASAIQDKDLIAILDDGKARKCAKLYNIQITGTIGLIFIAKELDLIVDLNESIYLLKREGLYLSEKLIQSIIQNE